MDADPILATLRAYQPDLSAMDIGHARVFGSVARCEPSAVPGRFTSVGVQNPIAAPIPRRVDVVHQGGLRPAMRERVPRDLVHAI